MLAPATPLKILPLTRLALKKTLVQTVFPSFLGAREVDRATVHWRIKVEEGVRHRGKQENLESALDGHSRVRVSHESDSYGILFLVLSFSRRNL